MRSVVFNLYSFFLPLVMVCTLFSSSARAQENAVLGAAAEYNAFILEDFNASSSDIQGKLAAGGNITLTSYGLASTISTLPLEYTLIAGGNISFNNGQVYTGSIIAEGSVAGVSQSVVSGMEMGATVSGNSVLPLDFLSEFAHLNNLSLSLSQLAPTGTVEYKWGGAYLEGDCTSSVQVFNLDGHQVYNANTFAVTCVPNGATLIFNLSGSQPGFTNMSLNHLSSNAQNILYNFYEATEVRFSNIGIEGSVLAPNAHINSSWGQMNGTIMAKSWSGPMELHHVLFTGNLSFLQTAPEFSSIPVTQVLEGELYEYTVELSNVDDNLTIVLLEGPNGLVLNDNTLTWQTNYEAAGEYSVKLQVSGWDNVQQNFTLVVQDVNRAPVIEPIQNVTLNEAELVLVQTVAHDPDGNSLTYALLGDTPTGLTLSQNGALAWQTTFLSAGAYPIVVEVSDGEFVHQQTFTITVLNINRAPVVSSAPIAEWQATIFYTYVVQASDADGDVLSFTLTQKPAGMTITSSGVIGWSPTLADVGNHTVTVNVTDGVLTTTQTYTLTLISINLAPSFTSVPVTAATENAPYAYALSATDPNTNDNLTFELITAPTGMSLTGNQLHWTPDFEQAGNYNITVQVSDGELTAQQNFAVVVANTNRAPVISSTPVTNGQATIAYVYPVKATDAEGDTLSITLTQKPAGMTINPAGVIQWTPTLSEVGNHTVAIEVTDGDLTVSQTYVLNIASINVAPSFTSVPVTTATENAAYVYMLNATDPNTNDTLVFALTIAPPGMSLVGNQLQWTPSFDQSGSHSVSVQVSDGELTAQQSFAIAVANVNHEPTISSMPVLEGQATALYTYQVEATDAEGDTLSITLTQKPAGMTINPTGLIEWTPSLDNVGNHTITIEVTDGVLTAIQSFSLSVTSINTAPEFTSTPVIQTYANTDYHYVVTASDSNGDAITFSLSSGPSGMVLAAGSNQLTWAATDSDVGQHSITLVASDNHGGEAVQIFGLEVLPNDSTNTSPYFSSKPITITTMDVPYRYTAVAVDPDLDNVTYQLASDLSGMTINAITGEINWEPTENQIGNQRIEITAADGKSIPTTQEFFVTVISNVEIPNHEAKDFWLMFDWTGRAHQKIIIASQYDTSGVITYYNKTKTFTVKANSVTQVELGGSAENYHFNSKEIENKGIHVTADEKISVYALSANFADGDAMLVLPTLALGTEYKVMTYKGVHSHFGVVATENNTTVEIDLGSVNAGDNLQITLNQGESYQLEEFMNLDPTGTSITSNKPIAVFGGADCLFIPVNRSACDRLLSQTPPLELWGDTYISAPLYSRRGGDTFRILSSKDNTVIRINNEIVATLNEGQVHQMFLDKAAIIKGSHPILVAQFSNSSQYDRELRQEDEHYDLRSEINNPELVGNDQSIIISEDTLNNFIIIGTTLDNIASITIDGIPVDATYFFPRTFWAPDYYIAQIALEEGAHQVKADDPFTLWENVYSIEDMADPFMAVLPTTQQYLTDYLFTAPSNSFGRNFVNITAPTSITHQVLLDGKIIPTYNFQPIENTDFSVARLGVNVGSHHLSAPEPIGVLVYGYDYYYSYGYIGGLGIQTTQAVNDLSVVETTTEPLANEEVCFNFNATDLQNVAIVRAPIKIQVSGINDYSSIQFTSINGTARYCYSGYLEGTDSVTFSAGSIIEQRTITWGEASSAVNHAPIITSIPTSIVQQGDSFEYQVTAVDINNDELTYSLVGAAPIGLTIDNQTGLMQWAQADVSEGQNQGDLHLIVSVSDGQINTQQSFVLWINTPPRLRRAPFLYITDINQDYQGQVSIVDDVDNDFIVTIEVISGPEGLEVSNSGLVRWAWRELGIVPDVHPVSLLATDSRGGTLIYDYVIRLLNYVPLITSTPPTDVFIDALYEYQIEATDNNGHALTYQLVNAPIGMTVNASGLIQWPAAVLGSYNVELSVTDGIEAVGQSWNISVRTLNSPPVITSTPILSAMFNEAYTYNITAIDVANDTLTYRLITAPLGMNIDSLTGEISWVPNANQAGSNEVVLQVEDQLGAYVEQVFSVYASEDGRLFPSIESRPAFTAKVGLQYQYTVIATDPTGAGLTHSLIAAPAGMSISSEGVISWTPAQVETVSVTVQVGNAQGFATQSWDIRVLSANAVLGGVITVEPQTVNEGEQVTLQVYPQNVAGAFTVSLTIDGSTVTLDENRNATITTSGIGVHRISATITDQYDSVTVLESFYVRDPNDTTEPAVTIVAPTSAESVTAPKNVIATIFDDNIANWRLLVLEIGGDPAKFTVLAAGTTNVTDESIGVFDPTALKNGQYGLILEATDTSGQQTTDSVLMVVEGDLKVGNFSITFEDVNIPLAGIPVRVTRTYDTRQKTKALDFGYGWSVGYQDVKIQESMEPTRGWEQFASHSIFKINGNLINLSSTCTVPVGEKLVTVTLPDGNVERFTTRAHPVSGGVVSISDPNCTLVSSRFIGVSFDAKEGTDSTLVSLDGQSLYLSSQSDGNLAFDIIETEPVDLQKYQLTTREGFVYNLDQNFGIDTVTDPNGNTVTFTDNGIFHSSGKGITFTRDAQGRITTITDPNNNVVEYTYNANGDLTIVTDAIEAETTFTYIAEHGLLDIIDPLNRNIVRNIYDDDGRLIAQEDNEGRRTSFDHDIEGRRSIVTNRLGHASIFYYDDRGNVTSQVDALGKTTSYTFDDDDNQLSKIDPLLRTTSATYNDKDDQLTQTDGLSNTTSFVYNDRGQETQITDALLHSFDNTYDSVGNLLSIEDPDGNEASNIIGTRGLVTSTKDLLGNTTSFTYNGEGNKLTQTDAEGSTTRYTYDDNNNVLTETHTRTVEGAPQTETTTFTYDKLNRVVSTENALGHTTSTTFDLAGQQTVAIDALNHRMEMDYDAYGRVIETRYADGTKTNKTYDAEGNLKTETDRNRKTTSFTYDKLNRLTHTLYANSTSTETEYDDAGQVIAEIDANQNRTEFEYDLAGRRTQVKDAQNNTHNFTYDKNGNLKTETDALGHTTTYTYNNLDQKTKTVYHNTSEMEQGLDAMGRRTSQTDQADITTSYDYDKLGRLIGVTDVQGNVTSYTYDEMGNKLTQTDAENKTTTWTYDALGRVLTRTLPMLQSESFSYDKNGNMKIHIDFNGSSIGYDYDVSDRVVLITYSDGNTEEFIYDDNGNQIGAIQTDANNIERITSYSYDVMNRLTSETQAAGAVLSYVYDDNGNRTKVTLTKDGVSTVTDYVFDSLNRLESVTDNNGITTYGYDVVGNQTSINHANLSSDVYTYDNLNRLTLKETFNGLGALVQSFDYTLGETGIRTDIDELGGRSTSYTYDTLYRLTSEDITDTINGDYLSEFEYDKVGNRTYETVDGVETQYDYDLNDRLSQQGGTTYSYDDNGSTLSETLDGVSTLYTYNSKNKLVSLDKAGVITGYTYNVSGIRTSKESNLITTDFIVDSNRGYAQVLLESNGTNDIIYTYGDDLISQERLGAISYYHYDGLGSTRALSNGLGELSDTYNYEAFGELLNSTGSTENDYKFTGEQFDSGLNQYYLRARYYNQGVGRFTQQDTYMGNSSDPITLHKYLYANADPVKYVDPSGNFSLFSVSTSTNIQSILSTTSIVRTFAFTVGRPGISGTLIEGGIIGAGVLLMKPAFEMRNAAIDLMIDTAGTNLYPAAVELYNYAGNLLQLITGVTSAAVNLHSSASMLHGFARAARNIPTTRSSSRSFRVKIERLERTTIILSDDFAGIFNTSYNSVSVINNTSLTIHRDIGEFVLAAQAVVQDVMGRVYRHVQE